MVEAIGGVNNAVCASFLSQLEVYDEDVGLVARTNTAQHKCLLFPIANFMSSALILKIATGANHICNIMSCIYTIIMNNKIIIITKSCQCWTTQISEFWLMKKLLLLLVGTLGQLAMPYRRMMMRKKIIATYIKYYLLKIYCFIIL